MLCMYNKKYLTRSRRDYDGYDDAAATVEVRVMARAAASVVVEGAKEGFYGYEKTPVRSDSCALLATRFGSVSVEDLVARISHFAAPVSGTLVRVRCACVFFFVVVRPFLDTHTTHRFT